MKKMFLNIPEATQKELEKMQEILQVVFDEHSEEEYMVLISGKQLESIKVDTETFDKLREK
jgi:hypothetical protein